MPQSLSHDLLALKVWFDVMREGAHAFTAEGAEEFSGQLDLARQKAEQLEGTAIAQAVRLTKAQLADPKIVPFTPRALVRVPLEGGDVA